MNDELKKKLLAFEPLKIRDPASKHVRKLDEAQKLIAEVLESVQSSEDTEDI